MVILWKWFYSIFCDQVSPLITYQVSPVLSGVRPNETDQSGA